MYIYTRVLSNGRLILVGGGDQSYSFFSMSFTVDVHFFQKDMNLYKESRSSTKGKVNAERV